MELDVAIQYSTNNAVDFFFYAQNEQCSGICLAADMTSPTETKINGNPKALL